MTSTNARKFAVVATLSMASFLAARSAFAQCTVDACINWTSEVPGWGGTWSNPSFNPSNRHSINIEAEKIAPVVKVSRGYERGKFVLDGLRVRPPTTDQVPVTPPPNAGPEGTRIGEANRPPPPDPFQTGRQSNTPPSPAVPSCARQPSPTCSWAGQVSVPKATGPERPPTTADLDHTEGKKIGSDPVDPGTGEFIIREADLEFPGFGVPFRHVRTYRSRLDYLGPLGYGWDHSLNRRLVQTGSESCHGELLLLTGEGSTFRFTATSEGLRPPAGVPLTITATFTGWTLTHDDGVVETFHRQADGNGVLGSIKDQNGRGLTLTWEASPRADKLRVASVVDSVGRTISYRYNAAGFLEKVEGSGLVASYEYAGNDLRKATSSRGASETYEYDNSNPTDAGDYVPESSIVQACQTACGPGTACGGSGACDDIERARAECKTGCQACGQACETGCAGFCPAECGRPDVAGACTSACTEQNCGDAQVAKICDDAWNGRGAEKPPVPRQYCDGCADEIRSSCGFFCSAFSGCLLAAQVAGAGAGYLAFTVAIANPATAYALGVATAITVGVGTFAVCAQANGYDLSVDDIAKLIEKIFADEFFRLGVAIVKDVGKCAGTVVGAGACAVVNWVVGLFTRKKVCQVTVRCGFREVRDVPSFFCENGCITCNAFGEGCGSGSCVSGRTCQQECSDAFFGVNPNRCENHASTGCPAIVRADCRSACRGACTGRCQPHCLEQCRTHCQTGCSTSCESRCDSIDFPGECRRGCVEGCIAANKAKAGTVKYGYPRDLNHNLVRVFDGAGRLYLVNEYGKDLAAPAFDAVISQTNGDFNLVYHYRDLAGEQRGAVPVPESGPALDQVDTRESFEQVEICPRLNLGILSCFRKVLPARRSTGAGFGQVARATVVIDPYATAWTYYFDVAGRLVRRRNSGTGAVHSFNYDSAGRLIGVENPLRDRVCIQYDAGGNPVEVAELPVPGALNERRDLLCSTQVPIRNVVSYTGFPVRVSDVFDPRNPGQVLVHNDWTNGNLTTTTVATGEVTTYDLESFGLPKKEIQFSGRTTGFEYDVVAGVLKKTTLDEGAESPLSIELQADGAGRPTIAVGLFGEQTIWAWTNNRIESVTRKASGVPDLVQGMTYDANGRLETADDGRRKLTVKYDEIGQIQSVKEEALDGSSPARTTCFLQGPGRGLIEMVTPEGRRIRYGHDGEGRLQSVIAGRWPASAADWDDECPRGAATADERTTLWFTTYDKNGRQMQQLDDRGIVTTTVHDAYGRPVIVDQGGVRAEHRGFDDMGNVVWAALYGLCDERGTECVQSVPYGKPVHGVTPVDAATEYEYDAAGRLEWIKQWHFDAERKAVGDGLATTHYLRDLRNNRITVESDDGSTTTTTFDGAGRPVALSDSAVGNEVTWRYRDGGRTLLRGWTVPTASGALGERLTFSGWGDPTSMAILEGAGDLSSRPAREQITWAYDRHRRLQTVTEVAGATSTTSFDAFGRPKQQTASFGGTIREIVDLVWDLEDQLVSRTSDAGSDTPRSVVEVRERDSLGRPRLLAGPGTRSERLTYVAGSARLDTRVDSRGTTFSYRYMNDGALLDEIATPPTGSNGTEWRSFGYSGRGLVTSATRGVGDRALNSVLLAYDSLAERTSEQMFSNGASMAPVKRVVDGMGRPSRVTIGPLAFDISTDPLGRYTGIAAVNGNGQPSQTLASFTFRGIGGVDARTYANGVTTDMAFDPLGRLASITDARGGSSLARLGWESPVDGVPRLARQELPGLSQTSVFRLDGAARLLGENHGLSASVTLGITPTTSSEVANQAAAEHMAVGPRWRGYVLDGRHNWVSRDAANEALRAVTTRDATDAYTRFGSAVPTYDANGALLTAGEERYDHNLFSELVRARKPGVDKRYEYDAFGRLVTEDAGEPGESNRFGYDGANRVLIVPPAGDATTVITTGSLDDYVAIYRGATVAAHVHQDRSGSVYMITDAAGQPLETYEYTAYGERTIRAPDGTVRSSSVLEMDLGFQGQRQDPDTALVHMRSRWYHPGLGRFLSPDPIGLAGGTNLFAFVESAPLKYIDPFGLAPRVVPQAESITSSFWRGGGSFLPGHLGHAMRPPSGGRLGLSGQAMQQMLSASGGAGRNAGAAVLGGGMVTSAAASAAAAAGSAAEAVYLYMAAANPGLVEGLGAAGTAVGLGIQGVGVPGGGAGAAALNEAAELITIDARVAQPVITAARRPALSLGAAAADDAFETGFMPTSQIRFTQNSIKGMFDEGGSIEQLAEGLRTGAVKPESIPPIRIFEMSGKIFTLDNRRLEAFRQAGVQIPVRYATPSEIRRELLRKLTTKNEGASIRIRGR